MDNFSRRDFLRSAALVGGIAALSTGTVKAQSTKANDKATTIPVGHVDGKDVIRVGIIGAGGRGTKAAIDCVQSSPGVEIVAIGDAFMDRCKKSLERLQKEIPEQCKVTEDTLFDGLDNYEKVLKTDCNYVILAAPPGFRPVHLRAAVEAGKHIFTEKPVAVDPVGIRSVMESSDLAKEKGLAIVAGTQRRHAVSYRETLKRIQDGAIGDLVGGQCYWMQEGLWVVERKEEFSDAEWCMRNWLYFDWTSGDTIVEQHVHNIDVINWAMGGPPVRAIASGGRLVRDEEKYGNIYDNFSVELEYANGARVTSMCRQWEGASTRIGERLVGTKGTCDPNGKIEGPNAWSHDDGGEKDFPYVNEHRHLIESIRKNEPLNEGRQVAESCLTAIMGRMAAYTGQAVSYNWALKASKLNLTPENLSLPGSVTLNPVPKCGTTKLV